jgi:hypothetical protein
MIRRRVVIPLLVVLAAVVLAAPLAFAQTKAAPATPAKVDLNSASQADLEKLPGVGPATAKKIIAGRPYAAVADLSKAGVPAKTIEKITPLVVVGAAAPAATPKPAEQAAPPPPAAGAPPATKTTQAAVKTTQVAQEPPVKGMVWVNTKTGVYHKEGDQWYGKTKEGKWMTEDDAIKAGYHLAKEGAAKKK